MEIIDLDSEFYPESLKAIRRSPERLYAIGNVNLLKQTCISIVGSRHATTYGIRNARRFSKQVSNFGLCVVSGMAIGIDSAAHRACIENLGKTIAVLPCGLNNVYPKANKRLFNEIISSGGLVISEYAPNVEASADKFVSRNRIVAGLSICTIVVEAAFRSGTSITAGLALEQGKKVFCIPGNLENRYSVGTNNLIKKGANLLTCIDDIIAEYPFLAENAPKVNASSIKIPREYRPLYDEITEIAISTDELKKKLCISISSLVAQLTMLELSGFISQLPSGEYVRNE